MTEPKRTVAYNYLPQQFPPSNQTFDPKNDELNISDRIINRIANVASRGDFTLGREVEEFEQAWADVIETQYAIGMSNGTDAIAIALQSAGMEPGEEVITSPMSFIATSGAILQAGGRPVFMDTESWMLPNIAPHYASDTVKWAVPVMWAGSPAFTANWQVASQKVIVDAAQGMNAIANGLALGALEIYALCYSLHPLKNINVWGDGGMIATNDAAVDNFARSLRNHGLEGRDLWTMPGYNSRLSTMQAAVGLEVLPTWKDMDAGRQRNAGVLTAGIDQIKGMHSPVVAEGDRHAWHLYQLILDHMEYTARDRQRLVDHLVANGVEAKVHYPIPLHLQPAVRGLGYGRGDFPNAETFCDLHVTLPIHEYLDADDMNYTLEVLNSWEGLR